MCVCLCEWVKGRVCVCVMDLMCICSSLECRRLEYNSNILSANSVHRKCSIFANEYWKSMLSPRVLQVQYQISMNFISSLDRVWLQNYNPCKSDVWVVTIMCALVKYRCELKMMWKICVIYAWKTFKFNINHFQSVIYIQLTPSLFRH